MDFFDSGGQARPAPAGVDREGLGSLWPCSVCKQAKNRDPGGRELWEGARVEAASSGGRLFTEGVVIKIRHPQPDAFGDIDPEAKVKKAMLRGKACWRCSLSCWGGWLFPVGEVGCFLDWPCLDYLLLDCLPSRFCLAPFLVR